MHAMTDAHSHGCFPVWAIQGYAWYIFSPISL